MTLTSMLASETPAVAELSRPTAGDLVSVIIPVVVRADDLFALYLGVCDELERDGVAFEVIFIFDGHAPPIPPELAKAARGDERLHLLKLDHGFGEATALRVGIENSRGSTIVTLSAYLQVQLTGIHTVLAAVRPDVDVVVTRRWPRMDGLPNRLQSRMFHALVRGVAGVPYRDMACGLRAMRRDVAMTLPLYGDLHRFIPALAAKEGYRVIEVDVPQHPLDAKLRIYSPGVYARRLLDVVTFFFLAKFTEKPLRFFGLVGGAMAAVGAAISLTLLVQRLTGAALADRPMLLLGALLLAIGVQVMGLGLIGEIIVHLRSPHRRSYRIRETI
jgi:glycosyltransferase involved in cell wall biosynthesis